MNKILGLILFLISFNVFGEISEEILQKLNQTDPCSSVLQLTYNYDLIETKIKMDNINIPICPRFETKISIQLKPGPDGNLYINYNGIWKRVVLE